MKVAILGAVIKRGHTKTETIKGPKYLPYEREYHDDEMMELAGKTAGVYGRHWVYGGTQMFNESNIHVTVELNDGLKEQKVFGGRTGLNDMIQYLNDKGIIK